jgi:hypothetical protein
MMRMNSTPYTRKVVNFPLFFPQEQGNKELILHGHQEIARVILCRLI